MYGIAMRLQEKIPTPIPIELIAYSNMLNVPRTALPHSDRTFTMICPYLRHYRHHIYDDGGPELETGTRYPEPDRINPLDEREYGALFRQWQMVFAQNGSVPAIFEYDGSPFYDETFRVDRQRYLYFPPPELRDDEIKWYEQHGVAVFYICSPVSAWPDGYHESNLAMSMWGGMSVRQYQQYFYSALAGRHGEELTTTLTAIANKLTMGNSPLSKISHLCQVLDSWLDPLSETAKQRYRVWGQYVEQASQVRKCLLTGDEIEGARLEKLLGDFLNAIDVEITASMPLHGLLAYSRVSERRLREHASGVESSDYVL